MDRMKDLVIVGSRDYAIEAYEAIAEINREAPVWRVLGFLDDHRAVGTDVYMGAKVVGSVAEWEPQGNQAFVLGIASPEGKRKVVDVLKPKGAVFQTIVSARAFVSPTAQLGEGCFILKGSNVNHGSRLGDFVTVGCSMVGGDAVIGDYSTTTSFVNITSCSIGKGVFVGSHSVVLSGRKVGDGAFVCAGSIVMGHVRAGKKVMGCPARPIG